MSTIKLVPKTPQGKADGNARPSNARHSLTIPQRTLQRQASNLRKAAGFAARALGETLYTTRCVMCDTPGEDLCTNCRMRLPYIDRYLACKRCGAPFGMLQCTECNSQALAEVERKRLPFDGCMSVIVHRGRARSIITAYKDAGQRQLAGLIASLIALCIPLSWMASGTVMTYVPADVRARRRRGFDHMQGIASNLASMLGLELVPLLLKDAVADQRGLSRPQRFANMQGRLHVLESTRIPSRALLVDDVLTTGATLYAASDALRQAGVRQLHCATFARAM